MRLSFVIDYGQSEDVMRDIFSAPFAEAQRKASTIE
jgi:hypothetical protein